MAASGSATRRAWDHGWALNRVGLGLMAAGLVAYIAVTVFWDPGGFLPWGILAVVPGALVIGYARMYLSAIECPACRTRLGGFWAASFRGRPGQVRYCQACGFDLAPELGAARARMPPDPGDEPVRRPPL
jgi:hypothetical protein